MTNKELFLNKEFKVANFCAFLVHVDLTRGKKEKDFSKRMKNIIPYMDAVTKLEKLMNEIETNYYDTLFYVVTGSHTALSLKILSKFEEEEAYSFFRELEIEGDNLLYTDEFKGYNYLVNGDMTEV